MGDLIGGFLGWVTLDRFLGWVSWTDIRGG